MLLVSLYPYDPIADAVGSSVMLRMRDEDIRAVLDKLELAECEALRVRLHAASKTGGDPHEVQLNWRKDCAAFSCSVDGRHAGLMSYDELAGALGKSVPEQLSAIIRDVARLNNHLSPFSKNNLAASFADLASSVEAIVPGGINGMGIKLVRFQGRSPWNFSLHDDKLVFVHRGRLIVEFRDREETIQEGEFIVIPHGVEHRPAASGGICEAVVIAPPRSG